ncbi:MAG: hypothetical protein ACM3NQ_12475 [Bacteroidales bacterium]
MDDLQHELANIERRTRRYWFEDGLAEIFSACVFLLLGLYFLAKHLLTGRVSPFFINVLFLLLVISLFSGRRLVTLAKIRYVYPRTGYVAFRRPIGHRYATALLAFVISVLMALFVTRAPLLLNWIPALEGLVFGIAFLWVGKKHALMRFPVEGLLSALIGLALSLLHLNEDLATGALFTGVGSVIMVGGVLGFRAYLRHAPPREGA